VIHPVALACLSTLCLGSGLVTGKLGLRDVDARTGAATSVPTAAAFFLVVSLFGLDLSAGSWKAAGVFVLVGLFFPAMVTILNFVTTNRIGASLTGSIAGTSPLFALFAALLILGEAIPPRAVFATLGVIAGVSLMSWRHQAMRRRRVGWVIALAVGGAAIRGVAQVLAKGGLALWPSPLAATVIGYCASASVLLAASAWRRDPASRRPRTPASIRWMMATGLLNGLGLMMMYMALKVAPVSTVAPIVATYPLVTVLLGGLVLHDEALNAKVLAGAVLAIAAVIYLLVGG